jgi:hypothetical protein
MTSRRQLLETFAFSTRIPPPRYESEFSDDVVRRWRQEGSLESESPEARFGLDKRDSLPVQWGRGRTEKTVVSGEADLDSFRRAYDPHNPARLPADWHDQCTAWCDRNFPLDATPWDEGFFQVLGIKDAATLTQALTLLCEHPELAKAQMDHYAAHLETVIDRVLADVDVDYAVFYEPIASNHGLVIAPETYRRHVYPALRRVVDHLERRGVRYRIMWSAGRVAPLIPAWMEAGINGLALNRGTECGLTYRGLRREYGGALRLIGGVDWRAVMDGPARIDEELERNVRPLLEQGGYVPHLDDTVRVYMPFEGFCYYREQLDALVARVFDWAG